VKTVSVFIFEFPTLFSLHTLPKSSIQRGLRLAVKWRKPAQARNAWPRTWRPLLAITTKLGWLTRTEIPRQRFTQCDRSVAGHQTEACRDIVLLQVLSQVSGIADQVDDPGGKAGTGVDHEPRI
jgi:hypothetical protein